MALAHPGGAIGILGWVLASLGLRLYLHFFNTYTLTYGSLGAVIILLTWFYLSGLMLLLGGAVNSEIEAAATEMRLRVQAAEAPTPSAPQSEMRISFEDARDSVLTHIV